jgi:hypothetical protein
VSRYIAMAEALGLSRDRELTDDAVHFVLEPMSKEESKDVYQLFLERTGRASTILSSNRDTAEWLGMFDVLLAQSAVDRFKNAAYDFVIEGESYRPRLKPKLDDADPPPNAPALKQRLHPRARSSASPLMSLRRRPGRQCSGRWWLHDPAKSYRLTAYAPSNKTMDAAPDTSHPPVGRFDSPLWLHDPADGVAASGCELAHGQPRKMDPAGLCNVANDTLEITQQILRPQRFRVAAGGDFSLHVSRELPEDRGQSGAGVRIGILTGDIEQVVDQAVGRALHAIVEAGTSSEFDPSSALTPSLVQLHADS